MREKYAEVVQITGISDLILEKVLDFIYAGSVPMTADTVCDLLEGAEYAQVDGELIILNVRPALWFIFWRLCISVEEVESVYLKCKVVC